jgi:hypothetical protein
MNLLLPKLNTIFKKLPLHVNHTLFTSRNSFQLFILLNDYAHCNKNQTHIPKRCFTLSQLFITFNWLTRSKQMSCYQFDEWLLFTQKPL